jgi:hypothetical protein
VTDGSRRQTVLTGVIVLIVALTILGLLLSGLSAFF